MDKIICIYSTLNSTEADLIKAQLEGAGIPVLSSIRQCRRYPSTSYTGEWHRDHG